MPAHRAGAAGAQSTDPRRGKQFVTPAILISQRPAEAADRAVVEAVRGVDAAAQVSSNLAATQPTVVVTVDRAAAADVFVAILLCGVAVLVARRGSTVFVPVLLALSLLGFASSVAVVRFVGREDPVTEPDEHDETDEDHRRTTP